MYGKYVVKGALLQGKYTENTTQKDYIYNTLNISALKSYIQRCAGLKNIYINNLPCSVSNIYQRLQMLSYIPNYFINSLEL